MILGITGPARSGKSTVTEWLADDHAFVPFAFANPIRCMLRCAFGWCSVHFDGDLKEVVDDRYGISPRHAMQSLGDWGRNIDPMFWVTLASDDLDEYPDENVVFSDVRFENEADMIRGLGGRILHISRNGIPPVRDHASEHGIAVRDGDIVVINNGTIQDLKKVVLRQLFPRVTTDDFQKLEKIAASLGDLDEQI